MPVNYVPRFLKLNNSPIDMIPDTWDLSKSVIEIIGEKMAPLFPENLKIEELYFKNGAKAILPTYAKIKSLHLKNSKISKISENIECIDIMAENYSDNINTLSSDKQYYICRNINLKKEKFQDNFIIFDDIVKMISSDNKVISNRDDLCMIDWHHHFSKNSTKIEVKIDVDDQKIKQKLRSIIFSLLGNYSYKYDEPRHNCEEPAGKIYFEYFIKKEK